MMRALIKRCLLFTLFIFFSFQMLAINQELKSGHKLFRIEYMNEKAWMMFSFDAKGKVTKIMFLGNQGFKIQVNIWERDFPGTLIDYEDGFGNQVHYFNKFIYLAFKRDKRPIPITTRIEGDYCAGIIDQGRYEQGYVNSFLKKFNQFSQLHQDELIKFYRFGEKVLIKAALSNGVTDFVFGPELETSTIVEQVTIHEEKNGEKEFLSKFKT